MQIIHTSDWHLGTELERRDRKDEIQCNLDYMLSVVKERKIGAILISGDVFDSHTPSNAAQKMYFKFLSDAKEAGVEQIVVTAGNHDSPTMLDAPGELLGRMNIHIVGRCEDEAVEREIVPLYEGVGEDMKIATVVCAVPYMIGTMKPGASFGEQEAAFEQSVVEHYERVVARAKELYPGVPLIAMGHFYASGGKVSDDARYKGNQRFVNIEKMPEGVAYWALGHLHSSQCVGTHEHVRYCGSLLQMSFAAHQKEKQFILLDTNELSRHEDVFFKREFCPKVREMAVVSGNDVEEIKKNLGQFADRDEQVWVAVTNCGTFVPDLKGKLQEMIDGDKVDIIYCHNQETNPLIQSRLRPGKRLTELTPMELFHDFLAGKNLDAEQLARYEASLSEILHGDLQGNERVTG